MYHLFIIGLLLLSPAILTVSLLFPIYWIGQYRLLRRTGSWLQQREFHARWMRFLARAVIVIYVLCIGAIILPGVFPTVRTFLESGWLLGVGVPVVFDLAILIALSPDAAAESWRAEHRESE